MAIISMFYGIIISMYFFDDKQHHMPHIHVKYQDQEAVFSILEGEMIEGELKSNKTKLVQVINDNYFFLSTTIRIPGFQFLQPIDFIKNFLQNKFIYVF